MNKAEKAINDCIAKRPTSAVRLQLVDKSIGKNEAFCSWSLAEIEATSLEEMLRDVLAQADQKADFHGRDTPFSLEWLAGDEHVARSASFRAFPDDATTGPSDGSIEAQLANAQKMLAEMHDYTINLNKLVGTIHEGTIRALMERIEVLEAERATTLQLKEELIVEAAGMEGEQKENMDRLMGLVEKVIVAKLSPKNPVSE